MSGREIVGPRATDVSDPTLTPGLAVICLARLLDRGGTPRFDARQYWTMLHLQISGNETVTSSSTSPKMAAVARAE